MINYEDKIDSLNESTELAFYENALECIGLNEGIDIKGKVEAAKNAVINFFKTIRKKISDIITKIKNKWKNSKLKAKIDKIGNKVKGKDGAEIAKKVSAKYIHGNKSVEKGGSEAIGTSMNFVKYADFGISYHPINDSGVSAILSAEDDGIAAMDKIRVSLGNVGDYNRQHKAIAKDFASKVGTDPAKLKASLVQDREQKLANISMATLNSVASEISKAQKAIDDSAVKGTKFDKACANAESELGKVKAEYFDTNEQFNSFKALCNDSISTTRSVFNILAGAIRSLSQYITQMYGVLDRIDAVCTTYNITDDSIR